MKQKIKAILWDYDGTLVNSTIKNMAVTLDVLRHFDPDVDAHIPEVLTSLEKYQEANYQCKNWRELYARHFGLSPEQTDEAGTLWTPCQLNNRTIPPLMAEGLREAILVLGDTLGIPMGICSQNSSKNIRQMLEHYGIGGCFQAIVGHDDIPLDRQKPDPVGFLRCLELLGFGGAQGGGLYVYIGDHGEDVVFGRNAQRELTAAGCEARVACIAAMYGQEQYTDVDAWGSRPDYRAKTVEGLLEYLRSLGEGGVVL